MEGLVSIVVPVYNAGKYIEKTIRMVQEQTFTNWELILVDDCSQDDGAKKIEPFLSDKIRLIQKEKMRAPQRRGIRTGSYEGTVSCFFGCGRRVAEGEAGEGA